VAFLFLQINAPLFVPPHFLFNFTIACKNAKLSETETQLFESASCNLITSLLVIEPC